MRHATTLAIGPAVFRVGSDWSAPIDALDRLYAAWPRPDRAADFTVRLEAGRPWRRWIRPSVHIRGDFGIPDALPVPLSMGLLAAEMGMNLQMALGWRRHVLIHASAIAAHGPNGDRAILMPGVSGSGKSTMAALLGDSGWRLMGDEFALLDPATGGLVPFLRLVSLKNSGIDAVETIVDPHRLGPRLRGTPKGDIRHLVPRADAIEAQHRPATPALILFPTYGAAATVRRVPPGEAFMRLAESSTNLVAMGEAGFDAMTRLARRVPAVAFTYPDGATGRMMLADIWDQTMQRDPAERVA